MTWWIRPELKNYDALICDGSIRSGKTLSMSIGFVNWSMHEFNGQTFAICGKTIEALRRNVTSKLPTWLEGLYKITEKRAQNQIIISGGGHTNTYYLFGGKDESSYQLIQGITLAGVLFDEVALMTRSFVEQAMARCSISGSKFWFNCNPENPSHWFYVEWIQKRKKKNALYLHFTMEDNLSLDPDVKERYENMYTGVFYRRYILGLWVRAEGLVYPMFDRDKHLIDEIPAFSPRHRYFVAIDYGTVNPFAAGLYDYDPSARTATKIREMYYRGGSAKRVDNEQYYKMLKTLIGDYPIECIVIDPSAAAMVETIIIHGEYDVRKAINDVLNGIQTVTKYLNAGVLRFTQDCRFTVKEFESYRWKEDTSIDTVIKEDDHAMDELRYFCHTILREELMFEV
jgi:PBSX family phage terminase large subunit